MVKKLLSIVLIILLFSATCFGDDPDIASNLKKKYDAENVGQQLSFTFLCAALGAAGGAAIWYIKTMKELNDVEQDYNVYDFKDYESAKEWLENKKKETEKEAKAELGSWVLGGAIIGAVLGIALYPESDSYSLINFSSKQKPRIRIPLPNYNIQKKRITIPIIEYNFR